MPELFSAGLALAASAVLTVAVFALTFSRIRPPAPTGRPVDLNMTHKELRDLATQHSVYDSRWRAYATKARLVKGLHKYGVTHA